MAALPDFVMPEVVDENESGWGPAPTSCPEHLRYLPFAPYSKNDRLGRACEWTFTRDRDRRWMRNRTETEPSPFVIEQVDEEGFHLVDTKTAAKPRWGPGARRPGVAGQQGRGGARGGGQVGGWSDRNRDGQSQASKHANPKDPRSRYGARGGRGGGRGFDSWRDKPLRVRVASVEVRPEWQALDGSNASEDFTMALPQMDKLKTDDEPTGEDVGAVGNVYFASKVVDKASVRSALPLKKLAEPKPLHFPTIDDPVIKKLASQGKAQIFTTDLALAVLMSAPRSVISWDLVVQRSGSSLFIDIREGSSVYDTTVNETAQDAPDDENREQAMNSMTALAAEAGYINYCYLMQCLDGSTAPTPVDPTSAPVAFDTPLPAGKGFRYRRWQLEDDLAMVVRCEIDGAMATKDGSTAFITCKALNEFDAKVSGIDWRQKLESQRAAVLANELKNNRNKLARWTCQALLAGVDYMKLGFISRVHSKDNSNHVILQSQVYRPEEFAKQIDLKTENMWGITRTVTKRLLQLPIEDHQALCKYLMLKDPNKPTVNMYKVPADAFDFEVEEEEGDAMQEDDNDSDFD